MALKDLMKKKTEAGKPAEEKPAQEEKKPKAASVPQAKSLGGIAPSVLLGPHVTEKAGVLGALGQYIFKVSPSATKSQVARAVYEVYGIRPRKVHTVNMPRKVRRRGRLMGFKSGLRKAIVTLPQGKTIEILPR